MSLAESTVCCIHRCGGKSRTNHKAIHDFPLLEGVVLPALALFKGCVVCARVCVFLSRAIQTCCNSPVNNDSWGLMQINGLQTARFAHFAAGPVERPVPDFSLFLQICRIWRPCPVLKISQAAIFVFLLSENFNKTV